MYSNLHEIYTKIMFLFNWIVQFEMTNLTFPGGGLRSSVTGLGKVEHYMETFSQVTSSHHL